MNLAGYFLKPRIDYDNIDRSHFREVSEIALSRLEAAKTMVLEHDFTTNTVLTIQPKDHLVDYCWTRFSKWCKEEGLLAKRTRLTEHQMKTRTPKQTRKGVKSTIYNYYNNIGKYSLTGACTYRIVQYVITVKKRKVKNSKKKEQHTPSAKSSTLSTTEVSPDTVATNDIGKAATSLGAERKATEGNKRKLDDSSADVDKSAKKNKRKRPKTTKTKTSN